MAPSTYTPGAAPASPSAFPADPALVKETPAASAPPVSSLKQLADSVPSFIETTNHSEIWGVQLCPAEYESHVPTQIVLQKYLNANDGDVGQAKDQLEATLKWRARMRPLESIKQ